MQSLLLKGHWGLVGELGGGVYEQLIRGCVSLLLLELGIL